MFDVVTIGDAMITLNPMSKGPMRYVNYFERKVGGAELNVAVGCARLGLKTGFVSCLGKDEFGKHILRFIRGEGIDTSQIHYAERIPTPLNVKEIREDGAGTTAYYRNPSPTTILDDENLPYDYLADTKILHISGVFAALEEKNTELLLGAAERVKNNRALVSFDPNIRLKLWRSPEEMQSQMEKLIAASDILLIGEEEAQILFNETEPDRIYQAVKKYDLQWVVIKQAERGAVCFWQGKKYTGKPVPANKVVDTVGAGDGFTAGFLYSIISGSTMEETLHLANTIGSLVVRVTGDNEGLPLLEDVLVHMGKQERIER